MVMEKLCQVGREGIAHDEKWGVLHVDVNLCSATASRTKNWQMYSIWYLRYVSCHRTVFFNSASQVCRVLKRFLCVAAMAPTSKKKLAVVNFFNHNNALSWMWRFFWLWVDMSFYNVIFFLLLIAYTVNTCGLSFFNFCTHQKMS